MISVNIRKLMHSFSYYLKAVKAGKTITILERNIPVAEIVPHNDNIASPGWKRKIDKIKIKGKSFSKTVTENRREESS